MAVTKWRGLDRALFEKLVEGGWIDAHEHRLDDKACHHNRSVLYQRVPRLIEELALRAATAVMPHSCSLGRTDRGAPPAHPNRC